MLRDVNAGSHFPVGFSVGRETLTEPTDDICFVGLMDGFSDGSRDGSSDGSSVGSVVGGVVLGSNEGAGVAFGTSGISGFPSPNCTR